MIKYLFPPCCIFLLLTGCRTHRTSEPHWSYLGEKGPEHWASLSPEFCACNGHNQSTTINGKSFPMEGHFVHADPRGQLAVVGLMIDEGPENEFLAALIPHLPREKHNQSLLPKLWDASSLLPEDKRYFRYNGSLTTPPCTEGVRWLILKAPVPASFNQISAFASALRLPNNRPLQPVNARPLLVK